MLLPPSPRNSSCNDRDVLLLFGQAHDAAVTKLSWAHPEFGSVLASSSFDRTVKIWEEIPAADNADQQPQANGSAAVASGPGTRWVERAVLADAKGSVRAVEFAPHQFGLKLVRVCFPIISYCSSLGPPAAYWFLRHNRLRLLRTIICACTSASRRLRSQTGPL